MTRNNDATMKTVEGESVWRKAADLWKSHSQQYKLYQWYFLNYRLQFKFECFFNIYTYKVRVPGLRQYLFMSTAGWIIHNAIEAYSYGGINSISARYDTVKKQHDSPFGVSCRCLRDIERLICGLLCSILIISTSRCISNGIHLRYISVLWQTIGVLVRIQTMANDFGKHIFTTLTVSSLENSTIKFYRVKVIRLV